MVYHKNIRQEVNSDRTTVGEAAAKNELLSGGGSSGQFDFGRGCALVISGTGNV